jgi:hypothetical protein
VSWGEVPSSDASGGDESGWGQDPPRNQLRPLNLGDVLDGAFRLARDHWRTFALGLGVLTVPLALISGLVNTLLFGAAPGIFDMLTNPEMLETWATAGPPADLRTTITASLMSLLASLVLTPLLYGTAVHIAATGYRGGHADPMASVRAAGRRYLGLLGAIVLMWIVVFGIYIAAVVLIVVLVAVGVGAGDASGAIGIAILAVILGIAAIVLVIIAATRVALTIPALMLEQLGPAKALRRSNALVKGKTGLTLGTLLVVGIITTIIGLVLAWPFEAIGSALRGALGAGAGAVATTVGQMVSGLVTNALLGAALVLIYFDRRVRMEGYDLTELADELGEPPDRAW